MAQTTYILGIAGGSGSGKSTLAINLVKKYPDQIALLQLDDYYKEQKDCPRAGDFYNWDHPDSLRFDSFLHDTEALSRGESINIETRSELYNPTYDPQLRNKIPYAVEPKKILVLEGHLVFRDERIRNLMTLKVFLDIPIEESMKRRTKFSNEWYFEHVLIPMHTQYIAPTKQYADVIIDALQKNTATVQKEVEEYIAPWLES